MQNQGSPEFLCSALDLTAHHWLARVRISATWLFWKTWKESFLQSSWKGGEDNISNCFPGAGDHRQHSCSFWKCQRGKKKVLRELSLAVGTTGDSRTMLHAVIILSWKHCSGRLCLTGFTNCKHSPKKRNVNYKLTADPVSLFLSDEGEQSCLSLDAAAEMALYWPSPAWS